MRRIMSVLNFQRWKTSCANMVAVNSPGLSADNAAFMRSARRKHYPNFFTIDSAENPRLPIDAA